MALLQRKVKVTIVVGDKTANDFYIPPCEQFKTVGGLPYLYEINLRRFANRYQNYIDNGQSTSCYGSMNSTHII